MSQGIALLVYPQKSLDPAMRFIHALILTGGYGEETAAFRGQGLGCRKLQL
jgi:hypothetical protein